MSISLTTFADARPYAYHLTAADNLVRICELGRMESAADLLAAAGRPDVLRKRRREHLPIEVGGQTLWIRDQKPLHAGNIAFAADWTLEDFVEALNRLVFFWPGKASGPNEYGVRHFERYAAEKPVIVRAPTADLFEANPGNQPLFCGFNSGSPRYTGGRASPRGPATFVQAEEFPWGFGRVVELTFRAPVQLPTRTEYGHHPSGPWKTLL